MGPRTARPLFRVDWLWVVFVAIALYGVISLLLAPTVPHASVLAAFHSSHLRRPQDVWPTVEACALQVLAAALFTWVVGAQRIPGVAGRTSFTGGLSRQLEPGRLEPSTTAAGAHGGRVCTCQRREDGTRRVSTELPVLRVVSLSGWAPSPSGEEARAKIEELRIGE